MSALTAKEEYWPMFTASGLVGNRCSQLVDWWETAEPEPLVFNCVAVLTKIVLIWGNDIGWPQQYLHFEKRLLDELER